MALTFEEYKALRNSGLSERQVKSMGEEAARAELKGYQAGQGAVDRRAAIAAPETVYVERRPGPRTPQNALDYMYNFAPGLPYGAGIPGSPTMSQMVEAAPWLIGAAEGGLGLAQLAGKFGNKIPALGRLVLGRERSAALGELLGRGPRMGPAPSIPPGATRVPAPAASALPEIPGGFSSPTVAGEVGGAASRVGGQSAGALQPIIGGAEAQAYREGGQAGLDAMREAARAEGRTVVQAHTRPLPKAKPKPKPKLSEASKARIRAANESPKPKAAPRRHPAANERAGGQPIPGELQARLRASQFLTPDQQALARQILDQGTPEQQAQVWDMLLRAGGAR